MSNPKNTPDPTVKPMRPHYDFSYLVGEVFDVRLYGEKMMLLLNFNRTTLQPVLLAVDSYENIKDAAVALEADLAASLTGVLDRFYDRAVKPVAPGGP